MKRMQSNAPSVFLGAITTSNSQQHIAVTHLCLNGCIFLTLLPLSPPSHPTVLIVCCSAERVKLEREYLSLQHKALSAPGTALIVVCGRGWLGVGWILRWAGGRAVRQCEFA